jgi:hypothetical protein
MASTRKTHAKLCFQRAFPGSISAFDEARAALLSFESTHNNSPDDSGIAGTAVYYSFSYEVARWLAKLAPGEVSIDWDAIDDTGRLDELLAQVLRPSEDEYFDSGYVSSREWIDMARGNSSGTDFDWLMKQIGDERRRPFWCQLYDAADLPLVWDLSGSRYSKSANVFPVQQIQTRETGMRSRPRFPKQEIQRPLESVTELTRIEGAKLIDVAMASLAVRHRETNHFNYANPDEVYLADVSQGVAIAVFGLLPEHRFPLECTMGFLILSNGVPVGYGGSSVLFRQVNTGINIFDEYRGSEASFLWVQVMRVYHALAGCTRFIANAYQFGGENTEALKSGAFWFYYRLGYRPVSAEVRKLAQRENARIQRERDYRSDIKTLRKLTSCDMHLTLPGSKRSDFIDEEWLVSSSMLASRALAAAVARSREQSANRVAAQLARDIDLRSLHRWSPQERHAFIRIAPVVAAVAPAKWSSDEKRDLRELLRAKGGNKESRYAMLLSKNDTLLKSLVKICRRADSE